MFLNVFHMEKVEVIEPTELSKADA